MDKKYATLGIVFLVLFFAATFSSSRRAPRAPMPAPSAAPAVVQPGAPAGSSEAPSFVAPLGDENAAQETITLSNDFIEAQFTNFGAAVRQVALKRHASEKGGDEPYVFNELQYAPALSFVEFPGLDRETRYQLVSQSSNEVVYRTLLSESLEVIRTYRLASGTGEGDPYVIRHETYFRNVSSQMVGIPRLAVNLGTAGPISESDTGYYLNAGYFDGEDAEFIGRGEFEPGFISRMAGGGLPVAYREIPANLVWGSVKNQFFASVLTPDVPGVGISARRVELPPFPGQQTANLGITANALFEGKALPAGEAMVLAGDFYVGPKEFRRLASLGNREDLVMQFGFFGFFSRILLTIMTWVHTWAPNWGIAIVITTVILKTVFLPLTLQASRSTKRMAKLQEPMRAIQEKYKGDPRRLQMEMIKLYKENKVSPVGGCLPILITIPFFFGFFTMLQSAAEFRFAEFLWIRDLSAPDTVARIFGFPLNIMPLLMGITMVIQMRITPMATAGTSDAARLQMRIFKWMPLIFTAFCYGYSSALALYWTVQNIYTIGQQMVINRSSDPVVAPASVPGAAARAKPVGPVTASRGKKRGR